MTKTCKCGFKVWDGSDKFCFGCDPSPDKEQRRREMFPPKRKKGGSVELITPAGRLCHACNEGACAMCTGDKTTTVIDGKIVTVPCDHGCQQYRGDLIRSLGAAVERAEQNAKDVA